MYITHKCSYKGRRRRRRGRGSFVLGEGALLWANERPCLLDSGSVLCRLRFFLVAAAPEVDDEVAFFISFMG